MSKQLREFYRILYPQIERPHFTISGAAYEVLDLSEAGVCFSIPTEFRPTIGGTIVGEIHFRNGKISTIVGMVVRIDESQNTCILKLTVGVPLPLVMEQQRYLLKKYPKVKSDVSDEHRDKN